MIEDLSQWKLEYLSPSILWFSCPRALGEETVMERSFLLLECLILEITYIISIHSSVSVLYGCITNNYNLVAYNNDNICFAHKFENWTGLGADSLSLLHLVSPGIV